MGKFANAIGIFDLKVGEVQLNMKPTMKDVKKFRSILSNEKNRKDREGMFDKFSDFMFELIEREDPDEDKNELREFVEVNLNVLLEETMITFKWTTKEKLEETKEDELKKLMSND